MTKFKVGDIIHNKYTILQINKLDIIKYHYKALYVLVSYKWYRIPDSTIGKLDIAYLDSRYDYLSDELKLELL